MSPEEKELACLVKTEWRNKACEESDQLLADLRDFEQERLVIAHLVEAPIPL